MRTRLLIIASLLLASASTASAQLVRPATPSGGITVIGRATVRARPDILRFAAHFNLRPPSMDALLSQVDAVTQMFVKAGIDANILSREIGPIYGLQSQGIPLAISGSTAPAPVAKLAAAYQNIMTSVASVSGLSFQNFNASYGLKDCGPAEEQAQKAAIADALTHAQSIAAGEHLVLGSVLSVSGTILPAVCDGGPQFQNGALDLSPQPTVPVTVQLTVTYDVRPSKVSETQKSEVHRVAKAPVHVESSPESR